MRPIDADVLKVLMMADSMQMLLFGKKYELPDAMKTVNNAPTIDAVPVIRCKDCIHNVSNRITDPLCINDYSGDDIVCDYFETDGMEPDDYCSYAERKEE